MHILIIQKKSLEKQIQQSYRDLDYSFTHITQPHSLLMLFLEFFQHSASSKNTNPIFFLKTAAFVLKGTKRFKFHAINHFSSFRYCGKITNLIIAKERKNLDTWMKRKQSLNDVQNKGSINVLHIYTDIYIYIYNITRVALITPCILC